MSILVFQCRKLALDIAVAGASLIFRTKKRLFTIITVNSKFHITLYVVSVLDTSLQNLPCVKYKEAPLKLNWYALFL